MDLRKLFSRKEGPPRSDELRQAIGSLEIEHAATLKRRNDLAEQRKSVLLSGTKAEAADHEAKLADASLDLDRLEVQLGALRERIAEAERAELEVAEKADLERADAAAAESARLAVEDYMKAAAALIAVLRRIDDLDNLVEATNGRLIRGEFKAVRPPQIIKTAMQRLAINKVVGPTPPLATRIELPHPLYHGRFTDGGPTLWPEVEGFAEVVE